MRAVGIAFLLFLALIMYGSALEGDRLTLGSKEHSWFAAGDLFTAIAILLWRAPRVRSRTRELEAAVFRRRPVAFLVLSATLKSVRVLRRIRRSVFRGREPGWAADVYGVISYVNFLSLAPTLAVIAASPEHFFKRVPGSGTSFNPLYKSPVKFVTSFAAFAGVFAAGWQTLASASTIRNGVIVAALFAPIIIVVLCGFVQLLHHYLARPIGFGALWENANLVTDGIVSEVFSWHAHTTVDRRKYFWSTLYFYVYAYFAVALTLAVAEIGLLLFLLPEVPVILLVICGNRWIVHRYFVLLRSAQTEKTLIFVLPR